MTTFPVSFVNPEDVSRIAANLAEVNRRIRAAGADPSTIDIVAVTKTFGVEMVRAARAAGLRVMGENYVDELDAKRCELDDATVHWHYLGALQSNKIAKIMRVANVVSGVSRDKEVRRIAALRPGATIDVQVDLTKEPHRRGAGEADVAALVELARGEGLDVRGLMTVASPEASLASQQFARVGHLCRELGLRGCSMGMSDDFELAVAHGSTEIRVGRALFGARTSPRALT